MSWHIFSYSRRLFCLPHLQLVHRNLVYPDPDHAASLLVLPHQHPCLHRHHLTHAHGQHAHLSCHGPWLQSAWMYLPPHQDLWSDWLLVNPPPPILAEHPNLTSSRSLSLILWLSLCLSLSLLFHECLPCLLYLHPLLLCSVIFHLSFSTVHGMI